MSRRKSRVLTLQMLFQQDLSGSDNCETLELFWKTRKASAEVRKYADFLFNQAQKNQEKIETIIQETVHRWRIDRMPSVDRNLLKMAISEYLYGETPATVVINEAIEIAKEYSGEKSAKFINGVLDAVMKEEDRRGEDRSQKGMKKE